MTSTGTVESRLVGQSRYNFACCSMQSSCSSSSAPGSFNRDFTYQVKVPPGLILHVDIVEECRKISEFSTAQSLLDVGPVTLLKFLIRCDKECTWWHSLLMAEFLYHCVFHTLSRQTYKSCSSFGQRLTTQQYRVLSHKPADSELHLKKSLATVTAVDCCAACKLRSQLYARLPQQCCKMT